MDRMKLMLAVAAGVALWAIGTCSRSDASELSALEFREIVNGSIAASGTVIPRSGVEVFTYEGDPANARVTGKHVAVEYGHSGVLFDRKTGAFLRRLAIADGWPEQRPSEFPLRRKRPRRELLGPGVLRVYRGAGAARAQYDVAASVKFGGYTWKAMQPSGFLGSLRGRAGNDYKRTRKVFGSWTAILRVLNTESFLQAERLDGRPAPVHHTMKDGLASNIVTHLAVAEGKLWAACVDIYDPERKQWGPGGLCCFDSKTGRWQRIDKIDGRSVRWITLLEEIGGELWVGFREGSGVAGDKVVYGMGVSPGHYRPKTTSMVLARLSGGKWTSFSREPIPEKSRGAEAPTETPRKVAVRGKKVFLFSETHARGSGNWKACMDGHISQLDLTSGKWRVFDLEKDFAAFQLSEMLVEDGEIIAFTNRGAYRWLEREEKWQFLDPKSPIQNPHFSAAAVVGNELWIGYTNQSFGVLGRQGISPFNEEALRWSYTSPEEIGTGSPIRGIVPMGKNGVWVLFKRKQWRGAARASSHSRNEPWDTPEGVGRLTNGKWDFPVKLDGVPESRQRERKGPDGPRMWTEKLPIQQIAGVGGKLFVTNAAGLYMGPGKWERILEGSPMGIEPSRDGKTLSIVLAQGQKLQRGLYDPATGKLSLSVIERPGHTDRQSIYEAGYLLFHGGNHQWLQRWTHVPTKKQGRWAIGPLETAYHAIVETPWAVWIASPGQLIRLDRKLLAQWLGDGRE